MGAGASDAFDSFIRKRETHPNQTLLQSVCLPLLEDYAPPVVTPALSHGPHQTNEAVLATRVTVPLPVVSNAAPKARTSCAVIMLLPIEVDYAASH